MTEAFTDEPGAAPRFECRGTRQVGCMESRARPPVDCTIIHAW